MGYQYQIAKISPHSLRNKCTDRDPLHKLSYKRNQLIRTL